MNRFKTTRDESSVFGLKDINTWGIKIDGIPENGMGFEIIIDGVNGRHKVIIGTRDSLSGHIYTSFNDDVWHTVV